MFPLVHLWVRAAAAVELHWEAQQVSDGPGPDPDDVRHCSSCQAPLLPPPNPSGGHHFESLKRFWGFFLRVLQEGMGLPEVSKASWVQLGRITGDLLE